jgi:hypothetical protein
MLLANIIAFIRRFKFLYYVYRITVIVLNAHACRGTSHYYQTIHGLVNSASQSGYIQVMQNATDSHTVNLLTEIRGERVRGYVIPPPPHAHTVYVCVSLVCVLRTNVCVYSGVCVPIACVCVLGFVRIEIVCGH